MTKGKSKFRRFSAFASLILICSCTGNVIYTDSVPIHGEKWNITNIPTFSIPVEDTVSGNDISLLIRTGSSYPFRNIYLFITTESPQGSVLTDTIEYFLADEKGNWYGKGFGDIKELTLPYKNNVFFPARGIYNIAVRHGMRAEDLKGVYDIGLKVTRVEK
ncbi:MAG: gliding motility lipoprotein GldH [Bacteroidales bacterium]|jgi:gliding motility-associated lipoprotein GldH|nr:gliding motility lipoprotein GldH [Bacteroidales bacterium]